MKAASCRLVITLQSAKPSVLTLDSLSAQEKMPASPYLPGVSEVAV